jgi:hypothetical protein
MIRHWFIGPVFAVLATPALAQDGSESVDKGFSLLQEGARILMESMLKEMEPTLRGMQDDLGTVLKEMEPGLRDLGSMIGDLRNYHAPEKLPNGDIIIRRKTPAEILTERGNDIEL